MAVVTISRQVGSGGDEIAALVCKELGYKLLDSELIAKLGLELGLTKAGEVVNLTAEKHHVPGVVERMFAFAPTDTLAYGAYEASGMDADARSSVVVTKIINHVYEQGNVVIEGRGSMVVLKDKPGVLHVRVVAPVGQRAEYLMKRDKIDSVTARDHVKEADDAQDDYIRRYCDCDITDPMLYAFIINTGKVTLEAAASAIVDAVKRLLKPAK